MILGDPARLQQVFTNLLGNSIKFTPNGGSFALVSDLAGRGAVVLTL